MRIVPLRVLVVIAGFNFNLDGHESSGTPMRRSQFALHDKSGGISADYTPRFHIPDYHGPRCCYGTFPYHYSRPYEYPCTNPGTVSDCDRRHCRPHTRVSNIVASSAKIGILADRAIPAYLHIIHAVAIHTKAQATVISDI
jgi:hypothetical protein